MAVTDSNIRPGRDAHEAFIGALSARLAEARDRLIVDEQPKDRRRSDRRQYSYRQLIAPYRGVIPEKPNFREVQCHDLSTSGFSFYTPHRPDYEFMVVELGISPNVIYVTARIRRIAEQPHGVGVRYLVGCEFLNRVAL